VHLRASPDHRQGAGQSSRSETTANPSAVGSMAIVVPGLERIVVVFPATLNSTVVTVCEVLVAVYQAVQESAFEHHAEFGTKRTIERRKNFPALGQADLTANTHAPTVHELGEDHLWAGLYPSRNERDV
jgi:hypothetical protein